MQKKSVSELEDLLASLLRERFTLRTQKISGQLKQTHLFSQTRRDIARIKTILNRMTKVT